MSESQAEIDQRLRDVNRRIFDLTARRAQIVEQYHGEPPSDISIEVLRIDTELSERRKERQRLQAPEFTPTMAKEKIDRMWDMVSNLEKQVPGINDRIEAVNRRINVLDDRLTTWFTADAAGRREGQRMATIYRVSVIMLIAADVLVRLVR